MTWTDLDKLGRYHDMRIMLTLPGGQKRKPLSEITQEREVTLGLG